MKQLARDQDEDVCDACIHVIYETRKHSIEAVETLVTFVRSEKFQSSSAVYVTALDALSFFSVQAKAKQRNLVFELAGEILGKQRLKKATPDITYSALLLAAESGRDRKRVAKIVIPLLHVSAHQNQG